MFSQGLNGSENENCVINGNGSIEPLLNGSSQTQDIGVLSGNDRIIIRIIGQYLRNLGLKHCVQQLISETGVVLDHPSVTSFRDHVLGANWSQAESDLLHIQHLLNNHDDFVKMSFLLYEQKYLELLEGGLALEALNVLRNQLTPLKHNRHRVHELSSYMMCGSRSELLQSSAWPGAGTKSRALLFSRLQLYFPSSVMVPENRLHVLLEQAFRRQCDLCMFHNTSQLTSGLLDDHKCHSTDLPCSTLHVIRDHTDEVWFCRFSPDGTRLATGSKDGSIIVWDVDINTYSLKARHTMYGPADGSQSFAVCLLSWSPDSRYIIAAHESPEIFIWDAVTGLLERNIMYNNSDTILCAAWRPDGEQFVFGGTHGQFYLYDMSGTLHERWEGIRVRSLLFTRDGNSILASDTHHRVCMFRPDDSKPHELLTENGDIMSMCMNDKGDLLALNIANLGVRLWDIQDRVLLRQFQGLTQGIYTVHSCFGGINQAFISSGSEECNVYVWHMGREKPVIVLSGHTSTVSCVAWHPTCPSMLVSCSDDATLRVWAPQRHVEAASKLRQLAVDDIDNSHNVSLNGDAENFTNGHSEPVACASTTEPQQLSADSGPQGVADMDVAASTSSTSQSRDCVSVSPSTPQSQQQQRGSNGSASHTC